MTESLIEQARRIAAEMATPEYKAREAERAAKHRASVMAESDEQLRAMQHELADRVLHDHACTACKRADGVINYDDELTSEQNGDRIRAHWEALLAQGYEKIYAPYNAQVYFQKTCEPCKVRRPYAWLREVPLARFREFMADPKRSSAFCLDELNEMLPPKGGFELL